FKKRGRGKRQLGTKRAWESRQGTFKAARREGYKKYGHPPWYFAYLKTPHWRAFKERWCKWYGRSGRWGCMICGEKRFELHHTTYERIGHELLTDVVPLCRRHHAEAHRREREGVP